jgi:hypothetical protein
MKIWSILRTQSVRLEGKTKPNWSQHCPRWPANKRALARMHTKLYCELIILALLLLISHLSGAVLERCGLLKWVWLMAIRYQGCQMACFRTKGSYLGNFWRVLQWKMLVYFMTIWSYLPPFGILCGHLIYFSRFGKLHQKNLATLLSTSSLAKKWGNKQRPYVPK